MGGGGRKQASSIGSSYVLRLYFSLQMKINEESKEEKYCAKKGPHLYVLKDNITSPIKSAGLPESTAGFQMESDYALCVQSNKVKMNV